MLALTFVLVIIESKRKYLY